MKTITHLTISTSKLIGFLLAICGNTLIACSYTMQKSAHNQVAAARSENPPDVENSQNESESKKPDSDSEPAADENDEDRGSVSDTPQHQNFFRHPTWLLGTLLMGLGEIGNFAAFAFAPASLVAPLGAWSVVLSAVLAHVFLREHISTRRLIGIILCVSGAILIGTTGPDISTTEANLNAAAVVGLLQRPAFVFFIAAVCTLTVVLMAVAHRTTLGRRYVFIYVGVSSLLGAVTVVCAKALSTFLKLTIWGDPQFGNWLPVVLFLVLAAAIALQLKYLNMAMARFGNAVVVPIYYVLFTACAMMSGVIMFREFDSLRTGNIPFFLGVLATMSGVFFIHRGGSPDPNKSTTTEAGAIRTKRKGYERLPVPSKVKQDQLLPVTETF